MRLGGERGQAAQRGHCIATWFTGKSGGPRGQPGRPLLLRQPPGHLGKPERDPDVRDQVDRQVTPASRSRSIISSIDHPCRSARAARSSIGQGAVDAYQQKNRARAFTLGRGKEHIGLPLPMRSSVVWHRSSSEYEPHALDAVPRADEGNRWGLARGAIHALDSLVVVGANAVDPKGRTARVLPASVRECF